MDVYLHAKFEVSSTILTRFRQGGGGGVILPPPKRTPLPPQNEPLKSPPRLRLSDLFNRPTYLKGRSSYYLFVRLLAEKIFLLLIIAVKFALDSRMIHLYLGSIARYLNGDLGSIPSQDQLHVNYPDVLPL